MSNLALAFILVYLSGLVAAFAVAPVWSFYIYEFVYFMNPGHRWWSMDIPNLGYSFMTVLVMMLSYAMQKKTQPTPKLSEIPATKWLIMLLVVFFMMYWFALEPFTHKMETTNFVKLMVVMTLAYKMIDSPQKLDYAIWVYLVGCAYIGIEANNMGRNSHGRVEGIGTVDAPDSNLISATIAPAIPFLMYFFWKGNTFYKLLTCVLGALILNGIVLINSRGAFLSIVAGGGYFIMHMLFSKSQEKNQRLTAIMVIVVGLSAAFVATDDIFWERMSTLTETEESDDGRELPKGSGRIDFWMTTFKMMEEHPLGLGIGGFERLSSQYLEKKQLAEGTSVRSVHSMWFQALGELGWQGLIIFLCLIGSCFKWTRKLKKHLIERKMSSEYFKIAALEAALLTYLVAGTFINRFRGVVLYWLIMFIMVSIWIYLRKGKVDEEAQA